MQKYKKSINFSGTAVIQSGYIGLHTSIILVLLIVAYSTPCNAQNQAIDSLEKILPMQPRDPQRVHILCSLSRELENIEPVKSIDYARQALFLADSLGYKAGMSESLQRLAITFRIRAMHDQALEFAYRALRLAEATSDSLSMYRSLAEISIIYAGLQDYTAMRRMRKRVQEFSKIDSNTQSAFLNSIGVSYFWSKNYDSALVYFRSAEKMSMMIKNSTKLGLNKANIAWTLCRMGKYDEALPIAHQALAIAKQNNLKRNTAIAKIVLAEILDGKDHYNSARVYAEEAFQLAEQGGFHERTLWSLERLSLIAEHQGNINDALRYQRLLTSIKDTLQQKNQSDRSAIHFSRYEEERREREVSKLQIQLLQKNSEQQTLWRNSLICGVFFTLALLALALNRYRSKQRSEAELRQKQELLETQAYEIQLFNTQLQEVNLDLQESNKTTQILSEIGREISSTLNLETILTTLYERINAMMNAEIFGIGIYEPQRNVIVYELGIEHGKRYPRYERSMSDRNQFSVWAITNAREIFICDVEKEYIKYLQEPQKAIVINSEPVPDIAQSMMYVPLVVKGNVLGVIVVQTYQKNAYKVSDLDLLRSIGAYAATALANASGFSKIEEQQKTLEYQANEIQLKNTTLQEQLETLRRTQTHLVQAEKMASLGTLVAGVAHELNTPIGVAVTAASTLHGKVEDFEREYQSGSVKKSALENFISDSKLGTDLTLRNLERAANLVQSFKQVAVDQTSDAKRRFKLNQYLHEIITSLQPKLKTTKHLVIIECDETLELETYPGAIAQIITNFVTNSLLHGFERFTEEGIMRIKADVQEGKLRLTYSDNGRGIAPEVLPRIFDPFFTTKQAQGGTGLGMHVVYNLVMQKLGGEIRCESELSVGTTFIAVLSIG